MLKNDSARHPGPDEASAEINGSHRENQYQKSPGVSIKISTFQALVDRGFNLIPLIGKDPSCNGKDWQQYCHKRRPFNPSEYHDRNAGLPCGPLNGIILDEDDPSFKILAKQTGLEIPPTFTVKTGGGFHYFFRYPKDGTRYGCRSIKHPLFPDVTVFDIKSDGGQVVAAGSIHPETGRVYEIIDDRGMADAPEWLLQAATGKLEIDVSCLRSIPPGRVKDPEKAIQKLKGISSRIKELILTGRPTGERSEAIMAVLKALIGAGVHENIIVWIFDHYPIGEKYRQNGIRWLQAEINRAKQHNGENPAGSGSATDEVDPEELKRRAEAVLKSVEPNAPFEPDMLPVLIRDLVNALAEITNADKILITAAIYASISGIIGRRVYMDDFFQRLFANLYILIINPSGHFKTTGLNLGSNLIYQRARKIQDRVKFLKADLASITGTDKESERDRKALQTEITKTESESPLLPDKCSVEGFLETLALGPGGALLLSEFGAWLKGMERSYNQGLKQIFTDYYDVPMTRPYKTKSGGLMLIERPYITICGVSTLPWVQENISLDDVNSGFFSRFILWFPPVKKIIPPALPPARRDNSRIMDLQAELSDILDGIHNDHVMELSPPARALFEQVHNEMYLQFDREGERTKEILSAFLKRWSPYILKFAMINEIIIEPGSRIISPEAIGGALVLVEYAITSTRYLFQNQLGESPHQGKVRVVLEYIAKKQGIIKRADLLASRILEGGAKDYDYVLETLQDMGRITVDDTGKNKSKWKYSINSII